MHHMLDCSFTRKLRENSFSFLEAIFSSPSRSAFDIPETSASQGEIMKHLSNQHIREHLSAKIN